MREKDKSNHKTWDEVIENIILGYQKWWPQDLKKRARELLFGALKERLKAELKRKDE